MMPIIFGLIIAAFSWWVVHRYIGSVREADRYRLDLLDEERRRQRRQLKGRRS